MSSTTSRASFLLSGGAAIALAPAAAARALTPARSLVTPGLIAAPTSTIYETLARAGIGSAGQVINPYTKQPFTLAQLAPAQYASTRTRPPLTYSQAKAQIEYCGCGGGGTTGDPGGGDGFDAGSGFAVMNAASVFIGYTQYATLSDSGLSSVTYSYGQFFSAQGTPAGPQYNIQKTPSETFWCQGDNVAAVAATVSSVLVFVRYHPELPARITTLVGRAAAFGSLEFWGVLLLALSPFDVAILCAGAGVGLWYLFHYLNCARHQTGSSE